uniref:Uncharacterized protein n=1 Tax=Romanomermis culicivorax TaxID=13658 RepID=A0A915I9N9_ROMCU
MIMKSANHGNVLKNTHPIPCNKALTINLNPEILTATALTDLQAATALILRIGQASGAMLTSLTPTTQKIVSGSNGKMLNETTAKISAVKANAAQLLSTNFQTNSNNIRGQLDWRPRRGAPPQRGSNHSHGARNYFY